MFEIKPSSTFLLKKRCLFIVMLVSLFVILVDVGITALLLYYINVSKQSIGEIRLNSEQTLINGRLFVDKSLVAGKILAFNNSLHFLSQDHIYIESRNDISGKPGSINIDKDVASIQSNEVIFRNANGENVLSINKDKMDANIRRLNLKGNARSIPSVQAESILSSPVSNLRISSPTKNTEIIAAKKLKLNSFGGEITIKSLEDIRLETSNITLDAKAIYMPKIIDRYSNSRSKKNTNNKTENKAYEICICRDSSKLFISNDGCLTSAGKNEDCGS